jgi:hypothetical protein
MSKPKRTFNEMLQMFYDDKFTQNNIYSSKKYPELNTFRYKIQKNPNKYLQGRILTENQKELIQEYFYLKQCINAKCNIYHSKFRSSWCAGCHYGEQYYKFLRRINVETDDVICSICINPVEKNSRMAKLSCKHQFHKDCIYKWLKNKLSCPCCRQQFTK